MPSKHIDRETWELIEDLQENICKEDDFASKNNVLKQVLRKGILAIERELNFKENSRHGKK